MLDLTSRHGVCFLWFFFSTFLSSQLPVNPNGHFFEVHSLCVIVVQHISNDSGCFLTIVLFNESDSFVDDCVEDVVVLWIVALAAGKEGADFE